MMDSGHPSTLELELVRLNAAPEAAVVRVAAHLATCPSCAQREAETVVAAERFARSIYGRTLPRVEERLQSRGALGLRWRRRSLGAGGLAAAAAAVAALVLVAHVPLHPESGAGPAYLAKGAPAVHVFVQRAGRVMNLPDARVLHPGDALRFSFDAPGFGYVMVVSVDGAGRASLYVPLDGKASEPLAGHAHAESPGSVVLDATLGEERLIALFSKAPLQAEDVTPLFARWAAEGASPTKLPRPGGAVVVQQSFTKAAP